MRGNRLLPQRLYQVVVERRLVRSGGPTVAGLTPRNVETALAELRDHGGKAWSVDPAKPEGPTARGPVGARSVQLVFVVRIRWMMWSSGVRCTAFTAGALSDVVSVTR